METIAWMLLALVAIYVGYVAYAIFVVHRTTRWLDPSNIEPAGVDEIIAEAPRLRDGLARLAPLGFVPCAAARVNQDPTQPRTVALRRADDAAVAGVTVFRTHKDPVVVTEFGQHDAKGGVVSVQDSPLPFLLQIRCIRILRFPGASASELWAAFIRIRAADPAHGTWPRMALGDEVEALMRESRRQVDELTERGMLVPANGPRPLTWRGAALFTLKMLWPWKWLVDRAQIAEARRTARLT